MARVRMRDRREAGRRLAERLGRYRAQPDMLVLALPRGGVPVAAEVARELRAPLDLLLVRKLGTPGHEELAMGAIASGDTMALNEDLLARLPEGSLERALAKERPELTRRERTYRGDRPPPEVAGKTVILVDDGLATGATMRAAVSALAVRSPARVVVAVPVAPPETIAELEAEVDEVVCLATPEPFFGVGYWYEDFEQTSDEEVITVLGRAWAGESESLRRGD